MNDPAAPEDGFSPGASAILSAAERLIGHHGVDGVSMRQITLAAKMGNNSAIAYHFGNRDGLLRAVSLWRAGTIDAERQRWITQARSAGLADRPEAVVQAITRPLLIIRDEHGHHPHAAFVSQMLRARRGREIRSQLYGPQGIVGELVQQLHRYAAHLPRPLFEFRLRIGSLAYYDAVVERDRMATDDPAWLPVEDEPFLAELDDMMLAILLRPVAD